MDFGDFLEDDFDENGGSEERATFGLNSQELAQIRDQKDAVIFLIDCHTSMRLCNSHNKGESNFQ